jgi:hypothetical protein
LNELGCGAFSEGVKPVQVTYLGPQQRGCLRHHEPGRLHRIFGAEVVVVARLTGQLDELLQPECRVAGLVGAQRGLCIVGQASEGESPPAAFPRRHSTVTAQVCARAGERDELPYLIQ